MNLYTESFYFIHVVKSGITYGNTCHLYGLKSGNRSNRAGSPHLKIYGIESCYLFLCGELMGNRKLWSPGYKSQHVPESRTVDLVHNPVDVIIQIHASVLHVRKIFTQECNSLSKPDFPVYRKSEGCRKH